MTAINIMDRILLGNLHQLWDAAPHVPHDMLGYLEEHEVSEDFSLPLRLTQKPVFPAEVWDKCRKDNDFMPILFEWYKYIGVVCNTLASISGKSLAIREVPDLNYAILTGLLNRCSRLMLSNTRLSVTKKYGETIMLLDRSIYESAVTVQWLCLKGKDEYFQRYLAQGLKSDLKLKDHILQNITERGGRALVIENRMLGSIEACIGSTRLSETQIREMKPLPDLWRMCSDVGLSEGFYIAVQRMGSHAVHGTWTALREHYLRQDAGGGYRLRDHDVRPHENQFMVIPLIILNTLKEFIEYSVANLAYREPIELILAEARTEMLKLTQEIVTLDFKIDSNPGVLDNESP
ncbi:MAG: DUF5677 domain-containing protein [Chloroflexi bacterium]|nr:DUF5677 domain-containing protein [Chloroflexota bacterium]